MAIPQLSSIAFSGGARIDGLPGAIANAQPITFEQLDSLQTVNFFTDCLSAVLSGISPYSGAAIAGGTIATGNAATLDPNRPGVIKLRNSATTNSGYRIYLENLRLKGGERFQANVNFSVIAGATVRIGFHDATTSSEAVDGAYFDFSGGVLKIKIANNSVITQNSSNTPTLLSGATDWYRFQVDIIDLTTARFRMYDRLVSLIYDQTITAAIPSGVNRETGAGIIATNTATLAADMLHVDMIRTQISGLVR